MNLVLIRGWIIDIEKCSWIFRVLCLVKNLDLKIYVVRLYAYNIIKMIKFMYGE